MNYEGMSDIEISKAVATCLGHKVVKNSFYSDDRPYMRKMWHVDKDNEKGGFYYAAALPDYCHNAEDAWPIIVENKIFVGPWNKDTWQAFFNRDGKNYQCRTLNENPLRAAMIVFLMMKADEA